MEELGGLSIISWLFIATVIPDIAWVTIVGIFYNIGKDQNCSIDVQSYMVVYIVIKVVFLVLRLIFIFIGWVSKNTIVLIFTIISLVMWIVVTFGYYIAEVIVFFGKDNDCKLKANNLYVGSFFITIEAWLMSGILLLFGGWAGILFGTSK